MDVFWKIILFLNVWLVFEEKFGFRIFYYKMGRVSVCECFKLLSGYDWLWYLCSWIFLSFVF